MRSTSKPFSKCRNKCLRHSRRHFLCSIVVPRTVPSHWRDRAFVCGAPMPSILRSHKLANGPALIMLGCRCCSNSVCFYIRVGAVWVLYTFLAPFGRYGWVWRLDQLGANIGNLFEPRVALLAFCKAASFLGFPVTNRQLVNFLHLLFIPSRWCQWRFCLWSSEKRRQSSTQQASST